MALCCCAPQAASFPPSKDTISDEYIVTFTTAGGRARGRSTVTSHPSNATLMAEYTSAIHGIAVRGKPAVVAALIANHPEDVLSIEHNVVVRAVGTQTISDTSPVPPGLWGLDRIDQVGGGGGGGGGVWGWGVEGGEQPLRSPLLCAHLEAGGCVCTPPPCVSPPCPLHTQCPLLFLPPCGCSCRRGVVTTRTTTAA